jgi:glycosyltransferase involved in cell wall biosynthesis
MQHHAHILFLPFSFNAPIPEVIQTSAPGIMGEYLTSGVPILAHVPPDTFISWYFRKHDCESVVDLNSVEAQKNAVNDLINYPDLRQRISNNAKECARIDFDPNLSSQAFMQVMEAAI